MARNALSVRQFQFAIILDEHRVAGRLEKNDGRVVGFMVQQREIMPSEPCGFIKIAHAEGRASAAFAFPRESDFEPGGFEHGDGGDADFRLVITSERVIPKNDTSTVGSLKRRTFRKPAIEPRACKWRQRTFGREAEKF